MNTFANVTNIRKNTVSAYKIISMFNLIGALEKAYVVACNSLRTANKIKDITLSKFARGRALKLIHAIRTELKKYCSKGFSLLESIAYRGVLLPKL